MRMINAVMQKGNFKCSIKGQISNNIYNSKKEIVGYEINIGNGEFKRVLIKNFNIEIKEVAIL